MNLAASLAPLAVYLLIGAAAYQLIRYAVKRGTLEALRQFRAEGGFAPAPQDKTQGG